MLPLAPVTARVMLCLCGTANDYRLLAFAEGVGDEGLAVEMVGGVEGVVAGGFELGEGGVELGGFDLFGGGVDEAELAGGEVDFAVVAGGTHGRAEGAAEDGAVLVEVAGAGGG